MRNGTEKMAEPFYAELHRELARSQARKPLDLSRADSSEHDAEFYRELPQFLERAGLRLQRRDGRPHLHSKVDRVLVKRFRAFLREGHPTMEPITDEELAELVEQA